jgi:hypothetical protein
MVSTVRHGSRAAGPTCLLSACLLLLSACSEEPDDTGADDTAAQTDGGAPATETTGETGGTGDGTDAATTEDTAGDPTGGDGTGPTAGTDSTDATGTDAPTNGTADTTADDGETTTTTGPTGDTDDATTGSGDSTDGDPTGTTEGSDTGTLPPDCPNPAAFDYNCTAGVPSTCPGGSCVLGLCLGPKLNADRYDGCGDGTCDPCETAAVCPADCQKPTPTVPPRDYDDPDTITIWVHGFSNNSKDELAKTVYGEDRGCGGIFDVMKPFGTALPCAKKPGDFVAKNQAFRVEYYGGTPAPWLTTADIAEIEQYPYDNDTAALVRYARIVAKFVRQAVEGTGATHVNMMCHSMGCLITRTMIENNFEGVGESGLISRWMTSAGVLAGAKLARLYDNPTVRQTAETIGLAVGDFAIMNPDFVMDNTAVWDHQLWGGNSPYLGNIFVHHLAGSDPRVSEALNIQMLDLLINPDNLPNDGIMFSEDCYFHDQGPLGSFYADGGATRMQSSLNWIYVDHLTISDTPQAGLAAQAALYGHRRVELTIVDSQLKKTSERSGLFSLDTGEGDDEIAVNSEVWFNPHVKKTFGKDVQVHNDRVEYRSVVPWTQAAGSSKNPGTRIYSGPVLDAMDALAVKLTVFELDNYTTAKISESLLGLSNKKIAEYSGSVPLANGTFTVENDTIKLTVKVSMHTID